MRINKYIASTSEYSRRKADELIIEGKVKINGKTIKTPGINIDPNKDKIEVDSKQIKPAIKNTYIVLNKPAGYISTKKDELNRKTIMDLLPKIQNLKPAGRLDKDTEGLIILSTDGDFINKITHPKYNCKKTYFAIIKGEFTPDKKRKLENGIKLENKKTAKAQITIKKPSKTSTQVYITIHEGRKRQIKKMFALIDNPVEYLQRIKIGSITLKNLKKGQYRNLTQQEIHDF